MPQWVQSRAELSGAAEVAQARQPYTRSLLRGRSIQFNYRDFYNHLSVVIGL